MRCTFEATSENEPGQRWQALFAHYWPGYRRWFMRDGDRARPPFLACRRALRMHMPELEPTYDKLVELSGGGDLAARFLSQWCPRPYISGCAQAVWCDTRSGGAPALVRNYDYAPALLEGAWLATRWHGRRVLAMSDCLWGVLDGINDAGLAASLSFGGRTVLGEGFGIPLVLRYVLEMATTTAEAVEILRRVPVHMSYNVSIVDRCGAWATVFVAPDRPAEVVPQAAITNHQHVVEWPAHARATNTEERQAVLRRVVDSAEDVEHVIAALLQPPLLQTGYERGYGTLYTAVYHPTEATAELVWKDARWRQSCVKFVEGTRIAVFGSGNPAPTDARS